MTGDIIPVEHFEDALELDADGYVSLFEIHLSGSDTVLYLKQSKTRTWQGNTYEGTGIKIEGVGKYADDTVSRPKLTVFNPNGVFSSLVDQGYIDSATVVRYQVLAKHVETDQAIYRRNQWKVSRIIGIKVPFIMLELRTLTDGQIFLTPARMFIPPEFPAVSLQ